METGGNLAYVVLHDGANKTKLHPMWDGLLGKSTSASTIERVVKQVEGLPAKDQDAIKQSVAGNKSIESWAKESFEIAKKSAYLVARVQVSKAGLRLAATIADVLK
jgi:hypothetical protein